MKTIFITGTSSGIGQAAVRLFQEKGWQVAATVRQLKDGEALAALPGVKVYAMDVTDPTAVKGAVEAALKDFGRIDALVNNAGYGLTGPLETASEEKIHRQFETNVFGPMRMIQALLPTLRKQGAGIIVNVTSIGGLITLPFNSIYHATKFAMDGLTESLNYELRPFGIYAKVLAPGGVTTDFAGRSLAYTLEPGQSTPYDASLALVRKGFESRRETAYSTPEQIAEVLYTAVTDGKDQIRYLAGEDAHMMYNTWKQMSNEAFHQVVKDRFGL